MSKKKLLVIGLGIAAILGGIYGYNTVFGRADTPASGSPMGGMPPMPVETITTKKETHVSAIEAVGTASADEEAEIKSEISGVVKAIYFQEGKKISKGAALIDIDDSLVRAEMEEAKANYDLLSKTNSRTSSLLSSGAVSGQEADKAKYEAAQSLARYNLLKTKFGKSRIHAPFDGSIGIRKVSVGDYVQVGEPITTLVSINPLRIDFSLPEKYMPSITENQNIDVTFDTYPDKTIKGKLYAVDSVIDPVSRMFKARATIDNAEGLIKPGMYGKININSSEEVESIFIPEEAIMADENGKFVYVVEGGKAAIRKITSGAYSKGKIEITEGLKSGDEVIISGILKIGPGSPVNAKKREGK